MEGGRGGVSDGWSVRIGGERGETGEGGEREGRGRGDIGETDQARSRSYLSKSSTITITIVPSFIHIVPSFIHTSYLRSYTSYLRSYTSYEPLFGTPPKYASICAGRQKSDWKLNIQPCMIQMALGSTELMAPYTAAAASWR
jgi:hypothetical protein